METLEEMNEVLGEPVEGEKRIIIEDPVEVIKYIKEQLKTSFEVTIWTEGWTAEQIAVECKTLTECGIVNCWDETINAFLCFRNKEDMNSFYERLQKELDIEISKQPIENLE